MHHADRHFGTGVLALTIKDPTPARPTSQTLGDLIDLSTHQDPLPKTSVASLQDLFSGNAPQVQTSSFLINLKQSTNFRILC